MLVSQVIREMLDQAEILRNNLLQSDLVTLRVYIIVDVSEVFAGLSAFSLFIIYKL